MTPDQPRTSERRQPVTETPTPPEVPTQDPDADENDTDEKKKS